MYTSSPLSVVHFPWLHLSIVNGGPKSEMENSKNKLFISFIFLPLFKYSCLHFPPISPPSPTHLHLLPSILPPLTLSMGPLYMFLDDLSPIFPHYFSLPSPLVTVSFLFMSMSLVIFCSLVCFID